MQELPKKTDIYFFFNQKTNNYVDMLYNTIKSLPAGGPDEYKVELPASQLQDKFTQVCSKLYKCTTVQLYNCTVYISI